jgi:hypothetical protein
MSVIGLADTPESCYWAERRIMMADCGQSIVNSSVDAIAEGASDRAVTAYPRFAKYRSAVSVSR